MSTANIPNHNVLERLLSEWCPCDDCSYRDLCRTGYACRSYFLFVSNAENKSRPKTRAIGDFPDQKTYERIYSEEDSDQVLTTLIRKRNN